MGNRRWNCHRKFVGQSPGHAVDLLQEFGVAALLDCYFRKSLRPAKISDDTPHPTLSRKGRGNLPSPRRRGISSPLAGEDKGERESLVAATPHCAARDVSTWEALPYADLQSSGNRRNFPGA